MRFSYFTWLATLVIGFAAAIDDTTFFLHNATLQSPDQYMLFWNFTETEVIFKLVVKNAAWVGFGFSPNGDMDYSDVVVAYFNNNGSPNFTTRSIYEAPTMKVTQVPHANLLYMSQKNSYTTVIFERSQTLCGTSSEDINLNIISGTQYFIWAYGTSLSNNDISYHETTNRGSVVLSLVNILNEYVSLDMTHVSTIDFTWSVSY